MTIVTKPKIEKKLDKPLEKPLVAADVSCGEVECTCPVEGGASEVEAWVSSTARRRISTATTICVCLTALLVMSIGIIGGVYLYRQFSQHQRPRFRGWCGIPYERETLHMMGNPKLPFGGSALKDQIEGTWAHSQPLFKEEFELDLEDDDYEQIRVPDFGYGRQGRFIHDFTANQTGIIDVSSGRCYVMPLNHTHVLPPRSLFDLIEKMWMGYYNVDTRVVHESTRIIYPPVEDYQTLGVYIAKQCAAFPTFWLQRLHHHEMRKRSVEGVEEDAGLHFVEFAGKNIVHLTIFDEGQNQ
ncbi:hypothetical protein Pcinc_033202 [Petrolisthes cinctipes]|uniref:Integral membrane protein 2 n=1 Tax=Petrolisthes cinctipes TaxID=88211 RepID=A0AAE1K269_PETCI|nr:hypothetical protein Pcinc_033202 [Petrolisthes cinctipes]